MKFRKQLFSIPLIYLLGLSFVACAQDLNPAQWPHLKGYWKFQDVKYLTKPTVGNPLTLMGTHQIVGGPAFGDTAIRIGVGSFYRCKHNMAPNGGGDSVNQYTLMYDFKVLSLQKWHTFHQTDTSNKNDGECFIRPITESNPGRIGTAATRYTQDSILPNQWYRLVVSVNMGHFYRYYLNGKLILEGDTQDIDGRFALLPELLFFADNNAEDDTIDIASVAVFDTCLSSVDIARIGTIDPCIANPTKLNLGKDTVLCWNETLNLSAGTGHKTYLWSNGKKLPFNNVSANALGLGQQEVWVQITDNNGCFASDTVKVFVAALPEVNLGKDTTLCGSEFVITGGSDNKNQYSWKKSTSSNEIGNGMSLRVSSSGQYQLWVTNPAGCKGQDQIEVVLNSFPAKPKLISLSKTNFCSGDSITLETDAGYPQYYWKGVPSNSNRWVVFVSDTMWVSVKDSNGCESELSEKMGLQSLDLPETPQINGEGGRVKFCEGDSMKISTISGFKKYYWQDGPGMSSRIVKEGGNYTVMVEDSNGCKSALSEVFLVTKLSKPLKPDAVVVGNPTFCLGEPVEIRCAQSGFEYEWSSGKKTRSDTVFSSGIYRISVIDSNGCRNISDALHIDFYAKPGKPMVYVSGKDTLRSSVSSDRYQWYFDGVRMTEDSLSFVVMKKSGTYAVEAMNGSCKSDRSDGFIHIQAGLIQVGKSGFSVYPNPSRKQLVLQLDHTNESALWKIQFFDVEGSQLAHYIVSSTDLIHGYYVEPNLPAGLYTILLSGDREQMVLKWVLLGD